MANKSNRLSPLSLCLLGLVWLFSGGVHGNEEQISSNDSEEEEDNPRTRFSYQADRANNSDRAQRNNPRRTI